MDYYETVVTHYLRADRAIFINAECCIQLNEAANPDKSGPHWYCDAVAIDMRTRTIFLCEMSYSKGAGLTDRLAQWHQDWDGVCQGLRRDSLLDEKWPVRPWLFIPEEFIPKLLKRLDQISAGQPLKFVPRITSLEMVQPWRYRSWNRVGELSKLQIIPEAMRA